MRKRPRGCDPSVGKGQAPPTTCVYVGALCPRHWSSPSPHSPENHHHHQHHQPPTPAEVLLGEKPEAAAVSQTTGGQCAQWPRPCQSQQPLQVHKRSTAHLEAPLPSQAQAPPFLRGPQNSHGMEGESLGCPRSQATCPAVPHPFHPRAQRRWTPDSKQAPTLPHAQQQGVLDRTCSNPKATLPRPSTHPHRAGRGGALSLAVSQGPSPHSLATPSQTVLPQQRPPAPGLPSWTALGSGVGTQFSLPHRACWGPTRNPHPAPTCFSGFATHSSHRVLGLGALSQPRSLTLKQGPSQQEAQPAARQSLTGPAGWKPLTEEARMGSLTSPDRTPKAPTLQPHDVI